MEIAVLANADENNSLVEEVVIHKIKLLFFVVLHCSLYLIVAYLFQDVCLVLIAVFLSPPQTTLLYLDDAVHVVLR